MGAADDELSRLRRSLDTNESDGEAQFLVAWRRRGFQIREALLALPRWQSLAQKLRSLEGEAEAALRSFAHKQSAETGPRALHDLPRVWVELQLIAGRGLTSVAADWWFASLDEASVWQTLERDRGATPWILIARHRQQSRVLLISRKSSNDEDPQLWFALVGPGLSPIEPQLLIDPASGQALGLRAFLSQTLARV